MLSEFSRFHDFPYLVLLHESFNSENYCYCTRSKQQPNATGLARPQGRAKTNSRSIQDYIPPFHSAHRRPGYIGAAKERKTALDHSHKHVGEMAYESSTDFY